MADSTASGSSTAAQWSDVPYLLQQYYHDDPKKLNDFRLPELDALCQIFHSPKCYSKPSVLYSSCFLKARFPSEDILRKMSERAILVTRWTELWAEGATVEECLQNLSTHRQEERLKKWIDDEKLTFDLRIHTFGLTPPPAELQSQRDAALSALQLKGTLHLGSNVVAQRFFLFVDVGSKVVNPSRQVRRVYLCREICSDRSNTLENDYRLNARRFIGPTSMPANLSFIMSNLGLVTKNSVVYDPFVGTGSLLVSAGHFGATCIGSDLDWKILHGKTKKGPISVRDNFKQYKLKQPEILCSDLSVNMFRSPGHGWIDAIVCDPPYGVRAGARKSGRAEGKELRPTVAPPSEEPEKEGRTAHIPTTQLYDVEDVIHDLLDQAAQILTIGGRLIYWLPTTTDFRNDELPAHPCLRQVSVAEQVVRSHFSRRLITLEKHVEFTEARRMHRRNKLTDPAPKYAGLKDAIAALSEEGPDRMQFDTATAPIVHTVSSNSDGGADTATASSTSSAPSYDPTSSFAPRPLSQKALKKLAKLTHLHARRQQEVEDNGGVKPSKRERLAKKQRVTTAEWKQQQKEKNLTIAEKRRGQKREAEDGSAAAPAAEATSDAATSASAAPVPSAAAAVADSDRMQVDSVQPPPSPPISQPSKKARTDEEA